MFGLGLFPKSNSDTLATGRPASRLFSSISFSALTGRCMISPAAMRFTTLSSRRAILCISQSAVRRLSQCIS